MAASHPAVVLAAREATDPGNLILPNIAAPPHPLHRTFGTLLDKLRDLDAVDGLIEFEEVSEDGRDVRATYWADVDSPEEARIVGAIAYWSACWSANTSVPVAGDVTLVE